jgi:hypothetical protein
MAEIVYVLCAATSIVCAVLLWRSYRSNRTRLLLWSGLCFFVLALNNALLFVDLVVFESTDLSTIRNLTAVIALAVLVYGLVMDAE